jgi:hypothetical protein
MLRLSHPKNIFGDCPKNLSGIQYFSPPFLGDVGIPQNHVVTRVLGGHTPLSLSPAAGLNHFDHVFLFKPPDKSDPR